MDASQTGTVTLSTVMAIPIRTGMLFSTATVSAKFRILERRSDISIGVYSDLRSRAGLWCTIHCSGVMVLYVHAHPMRGDRCLMRRLVHPQKSPDPRARPHRPVAELPSHSPCWSLQILLSISDCFLSSSNLDS